MNTTTRDTSPPGAVDPKGHPLPDPIVYRTAKELSGERKNPRDGTPLRQWLRVFEDGNDVLRAGLYDTPGPDPDDHWALGETVTDEVDAAMIAKFLPGASRDTVCGALLGIAYTRISNSRPRPLNIAVPERLKPWSVRIPTDKGHSDIHYVMADGSDAAKAVAAMLVVDAATTRATASCLA